MGHTVILIYFCIIVPEGKMSFKKKKTPDEFCKERLMSTKLAVIRFYHNLKGEATSRIVCRFSKIFGRALAFMQH